MRGFRISARTAGMVAAIGVAGCATMIRGTHESLDLVSTPTGARADLSTGQSCVTPCAQNIARDASFSVTFSKEGCDSQTIAVFPTLAGAGVLLGGVIDYGTGAVYDLRPNPVAPTLNCHNATGARAPVTPSLAADADKPLSPASLVDTPPAK